MTAAQTATATSPGPDPAVTSPRGPRQLRGAIPAARAGWAAGPSRGAVFALSGALGRLAPAGLRGRTSRWKHSAPDALRFPGNRRQGFLVLSEPGPAPAALPVPGPSAAPAGHGATGPAEPLPARSHRGAVPQRCHKPPFILEQPRIVWGSPRGVRRMMEPPAGPSSAPRAACTVPAPGTPGERCHFVPSPLAWPLSESGNFSPGRRASIPAGGRAQPALVEVPVVFCPVSHRDEQGGGGSGSHTSTLPCATCCPWILPRAIPGEVQISQCLQTALGDYLGGRIGGILIPLSFGTARGCQPRCPAVPHPKQTLLQVLTLLGW